MSENPNPVAEIKWPDPELELVLRKPVETPDGGTITKVLLREPTAWEWEQIMARPLAERAGGFR